ncbi:MAG: nuclear transport factor 2 family protein [Gammaproteobacteria bacterium]|nr:nuclear transport factor 2 family protein [Gammaproteobacteria bacterium]MDH4256361.1 nuclear transport factor 2 family protein [Gammaproteobacteria bacterium]MDH5309117.1 nuclear transport factor 2 family protein [Gammaproteobacteria bacterium]
MNNQLRAMAAATLATLSLAPFAGCNPDRSPAEGDGLTGFATAYAAAWSSQDPAALAAFYADDGVLIVNEGAPAVGRDAIERKAGEFMTAFPDMMVRLDEVTTDGHTAVFRWHWTGTNTGPGGTGNAVDIHGYEEWTLDADGLIVESRGHYDDAEYQRQVDRDN